MSYLYRVRASLHASEEGSAHASQQAYTVLDNVRVGQGEILVKTR